MGWNWSIEEIIGEIWGRNVSSAFPERNATFPSVIAALISS